MFNFWELSNEERQSRVANLLEEKVSDIERWRDPLNADGAKDHSRSIFTAQFIQPNSTVLDLGC